MAKQLTRGEIQELITEKALTDEGFRDLLEASPKEALESVLGKELPDKMIVRAVQETAETTYVIIPQKVENVEGEEVPEMVSEMTGAGFLDEKITCYAQTALSFASKITLF